MKFAVVAEYYPTFCGHFGEPFVVGRRIGEVEFIFRVVMVLNRKRGPRRPDCFR
jgi:hypothetical protein